jgi:hypothetical protein
MVRLGISIGRVAVTKKRPLLASNRTSVWLATLPIAHLNISLLAPNRVALACLGNSAGWFEYFFHFASNSPVARCVACEWFPVTFASFIHLHTAYSHVKVAAPHPNHFAILNFFHKVERRVLDGVAVKIDKQQVARLHQGAVLAIVRPDQSLSNHRRRV